MWSIFQTDKNKRRDSDAHVCSENICERVGAMQDSEDIVALLEEDLDSKVLLSTEPPSKKARGRGAGRGRGRGRGGVPLGPAAAEGAQIEALIGALGKEDGLDSSEEHEG